MKVFLLENVKGLGKIGEIREVKNAYAQNFLIPKKLAVLPNDPSALLILKSRQTKNQAQKEILVKKEKELENINGKKFIISAKADKNGHLYGSIGPKEIAQVIGIDSSLITSHFKQTGVFPLEMATGKVKIKIEIEIKNN